MTPSWPDVLLVSCLLDFWGIWIWRYELIEYIKKKNWRVEKNTIYNSNNKWTSFWRVKSSGDNSSYLRSFVVISCRQTDFTVEVNYFLQKRRNIWLLDTWIIKVFYILEKLNQKVHSTSNTLYISETQFIICSNRT